MKGVVLAGGLGTRLEPLTRVTNKHLLPVYKKPMILYPLETLKRSGIDEVMVICGREHAGHFMNFLGSGKEWGMKISLAIQDRDNAGIADALSYAEDFADGGQLAVVLGDNIFEQSFEKEVESFSGQKQGAMVFLKKVDDPERFGVAVFDKNKNIIDIEEKPKAPKSSLVTTGIYLYNSTIFDVIRDLTPSTRGELEITDAHNVYIKNGELTHSIISGYWSDAGTFESLMKTANWMLENEKQK